MLGTQLIVEWAALALLRKLKVSASNLVPETHRNMIFMVLHCTSRVCYQKLFHDCFLPYNFAVIYESSSYSTPYHPGYRRRPEIQRKLKKKDGVELINHVLQTT